MFVLILPRFTTCDVRNAYLEKGIFWHEAPESTTVSKLSRDAESQAHIERHTVSIVVQNMCARRTSRARHCDADTPPSKDITGNRTACAR